jgi:hypothetical protein
MGDFSTHGVILHFFEERVKGKNAFLGLFVAKGTRRRVPCHFAFIRNLQGGGYVNVRNSRN